MNVISWSAPFLADRVMNMFLHLLKTANKAIYEDDDSHPIFSKEDYDDYVDPREESKKGTYLGKSDKEAEAEV